MTIKKAISAFIILTFTASVITPVPKASAAPLLGLPEPGTMVNLSPAYQPAILRGITVHKDNPFQFDFIVDAGQDKLQGEALKKEGDKLVKYFLASLAVPAKDLWVNLSPYEKGRIVADNLGQTDMGQDLLAQDYILKQITASLIYPEKDLGRKFWDKIYAQAATKYGSNVNIPVNTFNKVWIMADKAEVFERGQTAFVTSSHLKVMLEEDYLATQQHLTPTRGHVPGTEGAGHVSPSPLPRELGLTTRAPQGTNRSTSETSQIIREVVLPAIEQEVNQGKNFATLRQIFNSIILASWYKNNLKNSILNEAYSNKGNVKGIDLQDKTMKEQIYNRYLQAYKKGVFNYIKDEPSTNAQMTPKKYFSGGVTGEGAAANPAMASEADMAQAANNFDQLSKIEVVADQGTGTANEAMAADLSEVDSILTHPIDSPEFHGESFAAHEWSNEVALTTSKFGQNSIKVVLKGEKGAVLKALDDAFQYLNGQIAGALGYEVYPVYVRSVSDGNGGFVGEIYFNKVRKGQNHAMTATVAMPQTIDAIKSAVTDYLAAQSRVASKQGGQYEVDAKSAAEKSLATALALITNSKDPHLQPLSIAIHQGNDSLIEQEAEALLGPLGVNPADAAMSVADRAIDTVAKAISLWQRGKGKARQSFSRPKQDFTLGKQAENPTTLSLGDHLKGVSLQTARDLYQAMYRIMAVQPLWVSTDDLMSPQRRALGRLAHYLAEEHHHLSDYMVDGKIQPGNLLYDDIKVLRGTLLVSKEGVIHPALETMINACIGATVDGERIVHFFRDPSGGVGNRSWLLRPMPEASIPSLEALMIALQYGDRTITLRTALERITGKLPMNIAGQAELRLMNQDEDGHVVIIDERGNPSTLYGIIKAQQGTQHPINDITAVELNKGFQVFVLDTRGGSGLVLTQGMAERVSAIEEELDAIGDNAARLQELRKELLGEQRSLEGLIIGNYYGLSPQILSLISQIHGLLEFIKEHLSSLGITVERDAAMVFTDVKTILGDKKMSEAAKVSHIVDLLYLKMKLHNFTDLNVMAPQVRADALFDQVIIEVMRRIEVNIPNSLERIDYSNILKNYLMIPLVIDNTQAEVKERIVQELQSLEVLRGQITDVLASRDEKRDEKVGIDRNESIDMLTRQVRKMEIDLRELRMNLKPGETELRTRIQYAIESINKQMLFQLGQGKLDSAMTRGGIDLIKTEQGTTVRKQGAGVVMDIDPAMLNRIKRDGIGTLTPRIINITPIQSIWPLLGMTAPKHDTQVASLS